MPSRSLLLACLLLLPTASRAHDYWLEPETFTPAIRKPVALHLHVGDGFISESERNYQRKVTLRFQHVFASGSSDLAGEEDRKPQARLVLDMPGTHVVRLDRDSRLIRLEAKKFNDYLKEEGLEGILAERKRLGESDRAGRERYWRCLKLVLRAGGKGDDTATKTLGQKLEILPLSDPTSLKTKESLRVRILFDGKPLAGAQVARHHRGKNDKITTRTARTSDKGEAAFLLDEGGVYLVRLVHMRRATKDENADWESFWGALTFAVP